MGLDDIMRLGDFCETLLTSPDFQFICAYHEQQAVGELLGTEPHETKRREAVYARILAHREFLLQLKSLVEQRDAARDPKPVDQLEDETVHEIYK